MSVSRRSRLQVKTISGVLKASVWGSSFLIRCKAWSAKYSLERKNASYWLGF